MEEIVSMSMKEIERSRILQKVLEKELTQRQAANLLSLSERQIRKLIQKLKKDEIQALICKKRGKPSNRQIKPEIKGKVLQIIQNQYLDFGPTLIAEKLRDNHDINLCVETIRKWMSQIHLWIPKQKRRKTYSLRERKECFGEMIQADGSHHEWFEGRADKCVLLVFIDDVTSKLTSLHFSPSESLEGYFQTLEQHLKRYGKPKKIYTDHFSVFEGRLHKDNLTQFSRALHALDIELILANSPQAKGRVERANRTLQDRLIKEMRLRHICSIEEANAYLPEFIEIYNNKFSKEPASFFDAHRPMDASLDLSRILNRYEERVLLNDLSFQFDNIYYKILQPFSGHKGNKVEIRQEKDRIRVFFKDKEIKVKSLSQCSSPTEKLK